MKFIINQLGEVKLASLPTIHYLCRFPTSEDDEDDGLMITEKNSETGEYCISRAYNDI